jgi:predicted dehydrogenase
MLRLGVIGFGARISGVINGPLSEAEPDLRVVGIVDPNEAAARERLAEADRADAVFYPDLAEMVKHGRLDALAIGTRCHLHTPYAIEAAKYDLPLFLEKPVATSLEQALSLEQAFTNTKCEVLISFPLRVSPLCTLTRQYIEEGAIGTPQHITALNYVPYGVCYFEMQYREYDITQGLFIQKATHDFDYMMYLMDAPIVRVAAMMTCGRVFGGHKPAGLMCSQCDEADTCAESPHSRKRYGVDWPNIDHPCVFGIDCGSPATGMNEDSSSALVEFASGVHGVYTQVFFSRRDAGLRGATVSGYEGTLRFDWYTNKLHRTRHFRPFSDVITASEGASHFGGDLCLAHNFIAMIQGKEKSLAPMRTGLQSIYTCLAAKQSAATGEFVEVRRCEI